LWCQFWTQFRIGHDIGFDLLVGSFKKGYELADVMSSCRQTVEEEFCDGTEVKFPRILPVVPVQCALDETIFDGTWLSGGRWTV
jgi:hypothetical protein